jgi:hypothetical protein
MATRGTSVHFRAKNVAGLAPKPSPQRCVLDANVVRVLGHPEDPRHRTVAAGLRRLRDSAFSLHLADGAIVELLPQIRAGAFKWPEWVRARNSLRSLLDVREPIMLGGWEALAEAGIFYLGEPVPPPTLRQETRAGWKIFMKARTAAEMARPRPVRVGGRWEILGARPQAASGVVQDEKDSWGDGLDRVLETAVDQNISKIGGDDFEKVVDAVGKGYDARASFSEAPPPSVRFDAMIRVYVHFCRLRLGSRPYNPKKRGNDAMDYDLLRYLALPALLCTCDERTLIAAVEQSGTWQRRWVMAPSDLQAILDGGPLPDLAWPASA